MSNVRARIERMLAGGDGLAVADGMQYAVPLTLPGEEVLIAPSSASPGARPEASLVGIESASEARVAPACRHFGVCGGCQLQHVAHVTQLDIKRTLIEELAVRNGIGLGTIAVASGDAYGYRNRIQLRVERVDGAWQIGYNERKSHRFIAASMCPIAADPLWDLATAIRDALNGGEGFGRQPIRELELGCDGEATRFQLIMSLDVSHAEIDRDAPRQFRSMCDSIAPKQSGLVGAGLWVWSSQPVKAVRGRAQQRLSVEVASWGERDLMYDVGHERYAIERGGFFQVNRSMIEPLVNLATKDAAGVEAWDLYAGVGLFSSRLMRTFDRVCAVEIGERSFRSLSERMHAASSRHRAFQLDTLRFLQQDGRRLSRPDLVVVDPPRSGLGEPVCKALIAIRPREIRYVSCDPATLMRDLRLLIESGYCLAEFTLVDMFPQTSHIESVARLVLP